MSTLGQKVIYQIYPKSFYDSNADGIGDLRGIISKIPYLKKLHVDFIWFNPFFVSPQHDNGYDIADYYQIDPRFGTMADFEALVAGLKAAGIGVMLDMVFNHCSTAHPWFQKALAGDPYYQAFFYLRPAKPDGSLPNNWQSKFGGPAWAKFGDSHQYYLHLYDPSQADLNWHNPAVRSELQKIVRFWMHKGVKGFRFDVLNVIGKGNDLVDSTSPEQEKQLYTDTPIVRQYLRELNQATFGQDDGTITVGEMSSTSIANSIAYTQPGKHGLSMVFTFHHLKVDYQNGQKWTKVPYDFKQLKNVLTTWQTGMDQGGGWSALFWNNHDQPWALNRFGDSQHARVKSAEMLATSMHLLRGTPFIYMGEEIGMVNPNYQRMSDYVDIEAKNAYEMLLKKGLSPTDAFAIIKTKARDNSRTPMHWDNSRYAGFSSVKPWLMPTGQDQINVEAELQHGEIFTYYQKLIWLRKHEPLISAGHIAMLWPDDSQVFAYNRSLPGQSQQLLVINNFSNQSKQLPLGPVWENRSAKVLISNYGVSLEQLPHVLSLRPYESIAAKC
mgnify:CR=1 FL=1